MSSRSATLLAGIPVESPPLFHRVRFPAGDPAAWISFEIDGQQSTMFIVRDIEIDRAKRSVSVDRLAAPADFTPDGGLSGDRLTATAQAVAECLHRQSVQRVLADRSLPFIFAWHIQQRGMSVEYAPDLGVLDRRVKDDQELQWLADAQQVTEDAMLMALNIVARASADEQGALLHGGSRLTCERLRQIISAYLLERGYSNPHGAIVASRPDSADCHARGSGVLKTGEAVILDIFPQNQETRYWGDCTRTVVHGDAPDEILKMHAAVVDAKAAATRQAAAGNEADVVHAATTSTLERHGYRFARGEIADEPVMPHGTGHGIGLEVHEPILLDERGGTLLAGEVFTIEPGLYSRKHGGARVEDMVVITDGQPRNFNRLPEGLDWR